MIPARQAYPYALAALTAISLAGCGEETARDEQAAAPAQSEREAMRHEDRRFLVAYGSLPYRVNVQYVDMIGQSVIAVRRGGGEAVAEAWPTMSISGEEPQPSGVPFEDERYRKVALTIADHVSQDGHVCADGTSMEIRRDADGEPRTLYRGTRGAWVVFAFCPESAGS